MGYGGIFKKVVRIAVPVVVGALGGGPLAVALSSAAATGATGGSFKESLMAGATSYIGSSISGSIDASIADANAYAASVEPFGGVGPGFTTGGTLASANDAITSGISQFTDPLSNSGFGGFIADGIETFKTPFDALRDLGNLPVVGTSLATQAAPTALGTIAGGLTTMTLNQALLAGTPEADDLLLNNGYTSTQIQLLKQEARNALSQGKYDEFIANTPNPGLSDEEFGKVLAAGIERRNTSLGTDVTQQQFDQGFEGLTGEGILRQETDLRKQAFNADLDQTFTGNAFDPIDDDIINSIVDERAGEGRQQVSNFAARGNLNPIGGRTANEFLTNQEESASNRVRDVGQAVLGGTQQDINAVGNEARSAISGYQLGDDLFTPADFNTQRQGLIDTQQASLGEDIRGSLGSEPLFNINKALQSGGRVQGQVSGQGSNESFLDAIAAREGSVSSARNRRGVGTRGSGAF
jgi:hypothetical protein